MGSRGASSGRSSGITKGMTPSEEQNLHDLAMASLVWRDDYALARGNDARKWIVNEIDTASKEFYKPTIEQNRFSTPQQALAFVVDKRKKK